MGNSSLINQLRTASEHQSEDGRRAAGSIPAHICRADHTLYQTHFSGCFVEDGAVRSDRVQAADWAFQLCSASHGRF